MILPVLTAMVVASTPASKMLFKGTTAWTVTDRNGETLERFTRLSEHTPLEAALSPDGKTIAFTAGGGPQLFLWDGKQARQLSPQDGFHGSPSFSADGKTVFFAHRSGSSGGPPGKHMAGGNAQLWRISVAGEGLQQLTSSQGCKGRSFATKTELFFSHNTCNGQNGIDVAPLGKDVREPRELLPPLSFSSDPQVSPNGRSLAFIQRVLDNSRVMIAERSHLEQARSVADLTGHTEPAFLTWSEDSASLFFVSGHSLFRVDVLGKGTRLLYSLDEPRR